MDLLIVFDNQFNTDALISSSKKHTIKKLVLFPLFDDYIFIEKVIGVAQQLGIKKIVTINTAMEINAAVDYMRANICQWSHQLGEQRIGNKTLKDALLLPGSHLSAWWLGLLAEKNILQTDLFFKLAQLHALNNHLKTEKYHQLWLVAKSNEFHKAVKILAHTHSLIVKKVAAIVHKTSSLKDKLRDLLKNLGALGMVLLGASNWLQTIKEVLKAKLTLPQLKQRLVKDKTLLFVAPFPAIEKASAEKGIYRNKYMPVLQDFFKEQQVKVSWLLIPVPYDGYSYNDAVSLAKKFINNAEDVFLLQEFLTVGGILKGIYFWLRQVMLSFYLMHRVTKAALLAEPIGEYGYPLIKSLWYLSFAGSIGVRGIVFQQIFNQVFKLLPVKDCLYHLEMQAWEKALNAAKQQIRPQVRTIGFQHSAFSINYWHLFNDGNDSCRTGKATDLPLPDVLAGNGEIMLELLKQSGYPNLTQLEAVRQLYIAKSLQQPQASPENIQYPFFVFGSNDSQEVGNLVSLVHAAFPVAQDFPIWFKGHPGTPVAKIFSSYNIQPELCNYHIFTGNVAECLATTNIILAPATTVGIEALAFGCEVIVPVFAGTMFASPLAGFEQFFYKVASPAELITAVQAIRAGNIKATLEEKRNFVARIWDLNPELPKWKKLFNLN